MQRSVLAALWVELLRDSLNARSYLAEQANLLFDLQVQWHVATRRADHSILPVLASRQICLMQLWNCQLSDRAVELVFWGFSHKLLLFAEECIRLMFDFNPVQSPPSTCVCIAGSVSADVIRKLTAIGGCGPAIAPAINSGGLHQAAAQREPRARRPRYLLPPAHA
eukprot:SAG11_NODE_106_length_16423_cov_51.220840_23_plen_166_part_00